MRTHTLTHFPPRSLLQFPFCIRTHLLTHSHHFFSGTCTFAPENTAHRIYASATTATATVKHTLYYLVKLLSWHGDSVWYRDRFD